jgi:HYR domain
MSQAQLRSRTIMAVALPLIVLAIIFVVRPGTGRAHNVAARATNFTVTTLADSGPGSLRDAIDQANMTPGADTIDFQDELTGTITLTSGELLITDDLAINGPGVFAVTVSGNHASRVFEINSGISVSISSLTISDGKVTSSSARGGGIFNSGKLALDNVVLSGNSTSILPPGDALAGGGAIFNNGPLTINNSTLSGNSAGGGEGGGIENINVVMITNSTLSGNSTTGGTGGGIRSDGPVTLLNSTLSGNSAISGGGIFTSGGADISFTTIANNSASSGQGGGIFTTSGVRIKNSIVANSTSGSDCGGSGTFTTSGVNFTTNGGCPGFTQVTPAQLNLGPLADNGGPTQTHALLPGSVAIDAALDCTDVNGQPMKPSAPKDVVETDQRGVSRPQGTACDAGSFEFVPCTLTPTITCPESFSTTTDSNLCSASNSFTLPPADCPCSTGGGAKPSAKGAVTKGPSTPKDASCMVTCAPPPAAALPKGTTTVTCTVTDSFNNTAQCSFTVTVVDKQPPTFTCPANIVKSTDPNQCSAVVNYTTPTATDNCDGPRPVTCTPASGSTFQKGTSTVTCTSTDTAGNTASCSFTVTVNDTQPPSITCPSDITTRVPVGSACTVITYTTPTATDNCPLGPSPVACTPPSGSCFARGTTTVTCTATDGTGNTASCSFRVTVFDLCLQDDSNPSIVVLANSTTGDYRFCCNGTIFTGRGKVTVRGSVYTIEHDAADRRVLITDDESLHRGSASLQIPVGVTRCIISDRDTRNNTCQCQ